MYEKIKFIFVGFIFGALVVGAICFFGTRADSKRARELQRNLDVAIGELREANSRSVALTEGIGEGIRGLKKSIRGGAGGMAERIRKIAKDVEVLEGLIDSFRGGVGSVDNGGDSTGGE